MTNKQWLGIAIVVFSVLAAGGTQLTDLIGPTAAKSVSGFAGLINAILGGILVQITGQGAQVRDVRAMPGIENIEVNEKASQTLAAMAADPAEDKVSIKSGAERVVEAKAEGRIT